MKKLLVLLIFCLCIVGCYDDRSSAPGGYQVGGIYDCYEADAGGVYVKFVKSEETSLFFEVKVNPNVDRKTFKIDSYALADINAAPVYFDGELSDSKIIQNDGVLVTIEVRLNEDQSDTIDGKLVSVMDSFSFWV